jgi:hypothetical protein
MTVYQKSTGETLVDSSGRLLTPECPPSEECCPSSPFPPWTPGDEPEWMDPNPEPSPASGECPSGCVACSDCRTPCDPRSDGLSIRCCSPEDPDTITINVAGSLRIEINVIGSPLFVETYTWSGVRTIVPGVSDTTTATYRLVRTEGATTVLDVTTPLDLPENECPVPADFGQAFTGVNGGTPSRTCHGAYSTTDTSTGGGTTLTRTQNGYSDCRRGYFAATSDEVRTDGYRLQGETQAFAQITYSPDTCRTPRLCDPAAGGGFIP